jgi:hypothetical protein
VLLTVLKAPEVTTALAELQAWQERPSVNLQPHGRRLSNNHKHAFPATSRRRQEYAEHPAISAHRISKALNILHLLEDPNMAGIKTIIGLSFVRLSAAHTGTLIIRHVSLLTDSLPGPRDRFPSCHPLRGAVPQLPYAPRCRDLRDRAITELAMWKSSQSR